MSIEDLRKQLNTAQTNVTRLTVAAEQAAERKSDLEASLRELGLDPDKAEEQVAGIIADAEGVVSDVLTQVNAALEETSRVG